MNILFAASEIHPLIKTGGLADVAYSLPRAIAGLGHDIRLIMPAYRDALAKLKSVETLAELDVDGQRVRLLASRLPGTQLRLYLVDYPPFFDRPGNPYVNNNAHSWADNAQRFALFCRVIVELAHNRAGLDWPPDILHCNDWHTGLVPVLLRHERQRPATVFTVHNLGYQGLFPYAIFRELHLADELWSLHALEFHDQLSFIKGGLVFADQLTTVSPSYAREIQTPAFGEGLDGLLRARAGQLRGILNGIDTDEWNPVTDPYIARHYDSDQLKLKQDNKKDLLARLNLPARSQPLIAMLGRLTSQKGVDLLLDALPKMLAMPLQLALLGTGEPEYEQLLRDWAKRHPERIGLHLGFDAELAHRLIAGADIFLMPSRYEPCGLTQLYSMRYGTVPLVRKTGGLRDTVVNATPKALHAGTATGFQFGAATAAALLSTLKRALALYDQPKVWRQLQRTGMRLDFSWQRSAHSYVRLYERLLRDQSPAW